MEITSHVAGGEARMRTLRLSRRSLSPSNIALWAMEPGIFGGLCAYVDLPGLCATAAAARGPNAGRRVPQYGMIDDRIASLELVGTLTKSGGDWLGSSTVDVATQFKHATANPDVAGILLEIDSPGGTVSGTQELADAVAAAAARKPVYAFIEDMGASAAYWAASQATKIFTNLTGLVGSIGTFTTIADWSKGAEDSGVRVHVIRAGDFKGFGVPGTAVLPQHLAYLQQLVDVMNADFLRSVAAGRRLSRAAVQAVSDGRVHVGDEARRVGLIDGTDSLDGVLQRLRKALPPAEE